MYLATVVRMRHEIASLDAEPTRRVSSVQVRAVDNTMVYGRNDIRHFISRSFMEMPYTLVQSKANSIHCISHLTTAAFCSAAFCSGLHKCTNSVEANSVTPSLFLMKTEVASGVDETMCKEEISLFHGSKVLSMFCVLCDLSSLPGEASSEFPSC